MKRNRRTYLKWIATAAVTAMVVLEPWFAWKDEELTILGRLWRQNLVNEFMAGWWSIDRMIVYTSPDGDLAAVFVNFDSNNSTHASYAQEISFRGSYAAYPRRLYFADEGTSISNGKMIINTRFDPTVLWLQEHQIWNGLYFSMRPGDHPVMVRAIVPQPQAPVPGAPPPAGQIQIVPWNPSQSPASSPEGSGK
jgi:hypothetical protein